MKPEDFNFHYWVVEVLRLKDHGGTGGDDGIAYHDGKSAYYIKFFPRRKWVNRHEWKYYFFLPINNDFTRSLRKSLIEKRNWDHGITVREITVAELKEDPTKFGLAIYKPNDYVITFGESEYPTMVGSPGVGSLDYDTWKKCETWSKVKRRRVNFTKKIGQFWAMKDFTEKYAEVGPLCKDCDNNADG